MDGDSASPPEAEPAAADPWMDEVTARIRDAAHGFESDGEIFSAESPAHGITGLFDAGGAELIRGEEAIVVRSTGWGRAGAVDAVSPAKPQLGACVADRADPEGNCIKRLEYADARLTEWWAAGPDGFQQGWTVAAPPAGGGALVIEVGVEGAEVTLGDGELRLSGDYGEEWLVLGLAAWDAEGTPLAAHFAPVAGGFRVVVADADAVYPVEIDPVYTTATTTLTGEATSNYFGWSVSGAGDVDNDGYDDVIVGAPRYSSGTGRAYVYAGSSAGPSSTATTTLTGGTTYNYYGCSVSGAGDVDNDGYDDVIVGAYGYSTYTGRAYVYAGSSAGVSSTATTTLTGGATSNYFGWSVSGAGDVDNDGYDDVIVGAYGYSSETGRAYVYAGSSAGLSSTPTTTLTGGATSNWFGHSVSGAGDVNDDGYDDVIVGAQGYSSYTGRAYVYAGSSAGASSTATTTLTGEAISVGFGYSVSGAGDVDDDGYDDVIVGAYGYSSYTGRAYVYAGSSAGVPSTATTTLTGGAIDDSFGYSVSGAGDVNDDGYDDVIVGALGYGSSTGRAYVYAGSSAGMSSTATTTLTGGATSNYFGWSVSGAGDVNNDGYDDVIVGAFGYSSSTGRAYVYAGYADEDGDGVLSTMDCDDADATVGAASTLYVDSDGDGYGSTTTGTACPGEAGFADLSTDCDDTSAATSPAATEICDAANTDEDCDGLADDSDASATGESTFYVDADGDGYGSSTTGAYCDLQSGYVADSTDCDDGSAAISPAATEICDASNIDEDCDGTADDVDTSVDAATWSTWYADTDADNFGNPSSSLSLCDVPPGYLADSTDCDDTRADVNPAAPEVCDLLDTDEDCDGTADDADASVDPTTWFSWYADTDADGYGDVAVTFASCDAPAGYLADATDCWDGSADYNPGVVEDDCADPTDYNCDGSTLYADEDGDTFAACMECDDQVATTFPAATELCNGVDDDCDGVIDDAAADVTTWNADADGDGYTDPDLTIEACEQPDGYALSIGDDCNDADASAHPGGDDIPGDGADQDCEGGDAPALTDGDAEGKDKTADACGCATDGAGPWGWVWVLGSALVVRRRRD